MQTETVTATATATDPVPRKRQRQRQLQCTDPADDAHRGSKKAKRDEDELTMLRERVCDLEMKMCKMQRQLKRACDLEMKMRKMQRQLQTVLNQQDVVHIIDSDSDEDDDDVDTKAAADTSLDENATDNSTSSLAYKPVSVHDELEAAPAAADTSIDENATDNSTSSLAYKPVPLHDEAEHARAVADMAMEHNATDNGTSSLPYKPVSVHDELEFAPADSADSATDNDNIHAYLDQVCPPSSNCVATRCQVQCERDVRLSSLMSSEPDYLPCDSNDELMRDADALSALGILCMRFEVIADKLRPLRTLDFKHPRIAHVDPKCLLVDKLADSLGVYTEAWLGDYRSLNTGFFTTSGVLHVAIDLSPLPGDRVEFAAMRWFQPAN